CHTGPDRGTDRVVNSASMLRKVRALTSASFIRQRSIWTAWGTSDGAPSARTCGSSDCASTAPGTRPIEMDTAAASRPAFKVLIIHVLPVAEDLGRCRPAPTVPNGIRFMTLCATTLAEPARGGLSSHGNGSVRMELGSDLLTQLYATVDNPQRWTPLLDHLRVRLGAGSAVVQILNDTPERLDPIWQAR